jgi:AraC family transcriptional regulator of adaptative response / DNA-3-methyladenine glycosylase II
VSCDVRAAHPDDVPEVVGALRRWLDLDTDPADVDGALGADPVLARLIAARPGLRVLGSPDGFETAALAILGQQVSLAAARTFAGRLVAAFGRPEAEGMTAFPEPAALVTAGPDAIRAAVGVTGARSRVAPHVRRGGGGRAPPRPRRRPRGDARRPPRPAGHRSLDRRLHRAPGARRPRRLPLGETWCCAGRSGGVTARGAERMADACRPWRAYAAVHLWTREVFS